MPDVDAALMRKLKWRILPIILVAFLLAYLDRVNVGYGAASMNAQLGFGPAVYGFAAGVFFLGYALFEIPSNYMIRLVGARRWFARIMISWGCVSCATAFVWNDTTFYILRFTLGVAEAGFFPGVLFFLTLWFPAAERAKTAGLIIMGAPIAAVIGAPLSGLILQAGPIGGFSGWQLMFIVEAIPSIAMGVILFFFLSDNPDTAAWLTEGERHQLTTRLAFEQAQRAQTAKSGFLAAILDWKVLTCGLVYFSINVGIYGVLLWLPQILKSLGGQQPIWLASIPYVASVIAIVLWTRRSDRYQERVWHVVIPCATAALGLGSSVVLADPAWSLLALTVAAASTWAALATFWGLPSTFLAGAGMASGLAAINALGQLGGFVGPFAIGYIREATGSFAAGMATLTGSLLIAAMLPLMLKSGLLSRAAATAPSASLLA